MNDLEKRLQQARLTLLLDFPFFGQLALRLEPVIDPAVETAATDGLTIRFNPAYCERLPDKQLVYLYAHEVSHPALGHLWRIGSRDMRKANIAADYAVNEMLHKVIRSQPGAAHRMAEIPSRLLDSKFFGKSMEEIYDLLPDPDTQPGNKPQPLGTFTKPGERKPSEEPDQPDPSGGEPQPGAGQGSSTLQQEWQSAVATAATVARSRNRGELPGNIASLISEMLEPEVPWQDLLRQFASRICRDDYTFRRPNRRFAHQGIMLPSLRSEGLGTIAVAVDTSGSIYSNRKLLDTFLSELQGILETTSPEAVHLLDCDSRIQAHHEIRKGDNLLDIGFKGGGGTRFEPVFDWLADNGTQPDCLIYFTDLEGSFPRTEPPYPVLWLNYGCRSSKAPFGQTIHVEA
jgi:predicted metal-dependent peptidase